MSRRMDDVFVDTVLKDEIGKINSHLPKLRKTLKELLSEKDPQVPTIRGEKIRMKKSDLQNLSDIVPENARERIKLPIILMRRMDLGPGAFTIVGDPYEEFILALLSGSFQGNFDEFRHSSTSPVVVYRPQITELLAKIHSLVVLGFGVSETSAGSKPV
jgi:uncharacterized protein (UPF0216 family)